MTNALRAGVPALLVVGLLGCDGGTLELSGEPTGCLSDSQCPLGHLCNADGECVGGPGVVRVAYEDEPDTGPAVDTQDEDAPGPDSLEVGEDTRPDVELDAAPEDPCVTNPPCDDGNPCTQDECDPKKGCVFETLTDVPCDDGNVCTKADTCAGGVCKGTYDLCDDDQPCTFDYCEKGSGCVHEALADVPCDDGDVCTFDTGCVAGECVGEAVVCDDGGPCVDVSCDTTEGCVAVPNVALCDDGDACTIEDQCDAGVCSGVALGCECHTNADCASMDDGDMCNGVLFCDFSVLPFACAVDPLTVVVCPAAIGPNAGCLEPACDPTNGTCSLASVAEGEACEDGDLCTAAEACSAGQCVPKELVDCGDGNACTTDVCKAAEGCSYVEKTSLCDDGSACTALDVCQAGSCVGVPVDCDDADPCTDDACSAELGCVHPPKDGGACEDGSACTTGDICIAGLCMGGAPPECDDWNPCTDDGCLESAGCVNAPNELPCDDGDLCTTTDLCALGSCVGGPQQDCADGDACTSDHCDAGWGCSNAEIGDDCDDGNPCTDDTCSAEEGCLYPQSVDGTPCGGGLCQWGECCASKCTGKECGDDGCGGSCGACGGGHSCDVGVCVQNIPELSWVAIEGGPFWMGCPTGICPDPDEYPSHPVAVQPFELLAVEVTEQQYLTAVGVNPACESGGGDHPAECVSWDDAADFCARVGARLPTEAEWERAVRAGTKTLYGCGADPSCLADVAWHADVAKHPAGTKAANAYGLHDMTGNLREWVQDCYHPSYDGAPSVGLPAWESPCEGGRVVRGCGYLDEASACTASARSGLPADADDEPDVGFRCARAPGP